MTNMETPICIYNILTENKYVIPVYQRNFAWEKEHIEQLLNDIYHANGNYYLGSLVTQQYDDKFEVVDGQQRLTTLNLIFAFLANEASIKHTCNLSFDIRKVNNIYLESIFSDFNNHYYYNEETKNLYYGIKVISNWFQNNCKTNNHINAFINKLKNNIYIFRIVLPKECDLNHYFEVMNIRGKQLEPHEILKARLMDKIDKTYHKDFDFVWTVCSDMHSYISEKIDQNKYSYEWHLKIDNESKTEPKNDTNNNEIAIKDILKEILQKNDFNIKISTNTEIETEKVRSIIDFPNFLLLVLRLMKTDISLNDKNLISQFDKYLNEKNFAEDFIEHLLYYRIWFDSYVIKRIKNDEDNDYEWTIKSYSSEKDTIKYKTAIMLQSMLHVSFPGYSYKEWLFSFMRMNKKHEHISIEKMNGLLWEISQETIKQYSTKEYLQESLGTNFNHFLFNYLDFLLWSKYIKDVYNKKEEDILNDKLTECIFKKRETFSNFRFSVRESIEHLYPRKREKELLDGDNNKLEDINHMINSIGNLCLISKRSNSSYSDDLPTQKRVDSRKKRTESLKQQIMFASFDETKKDELKWGLEEMKTHQEIIINLIVNSLYKSIDEI